MEPLLEKILDSASGRPLTADETAGLRERWPAMSLPLLAALKNPRRRDAEEARALAAQLAITLPEQESLRDILGEDAELLANFYPSTPKATPSTTETIDTFLATFGGGAAGDRATEALEKAIFNPVPDYAAMLAAEERHSAPTTDEMDADKVGQHDAAINRYIASHSGPAPVPTTPAPSVAEAEMAVGIVVEAESPESGEKAVVSETTPAPGQRTQEEITAKSNSLSESLAKIMIRNHNYSKALEIISELNLNNPEKSAYFADQIRFLKKLIINENKSKH